MINATEITTEDKSVEELQVLHAEMLATAADLGLEVPDDLSLEFETAATGRATCDSLHDRIVKFRAGLDESSERDVLDDIAKGGDQGDAGDPANDAAAAQETKAAKPKRGSRAKKSAGTKAPTSESVDAVDAAPVGLNDENTPSKPKRAAKGRKGQSEPEQPAQPEEEKTDVTTVAKKAPAKGKKAAPAKKAAKKAAPKPAAKKSTAAKPAKKAPANPMPAARKYGDNDKIKVIDKNPAALEKKSKWADRLKKVMAANGKKVKDAGVSLADIRTAEWRGVIEVG